MGIGKIKTICAVSDSQTNKFLTLKTKLIKFALSSIATHSLSHPFSNFCFFSPSLVSLDWKMISKILKVLKNFTTINFSTYQFFNKIFRIKSLLKGVPKEKTVPRSWKVTFHFQKIFFPTKNISRPKKFFFKNGI